MAEVPASQAEASVPSESLDQQLATAGFEWMTTSSVRPDGAAIRVLVSRGAVATVITDSAQTSGWLLQHARLGRLPLRVKATLEGICRMNDLTLERGAVVARLQPGSAAAQVVQAAERVGRVCARIAKLRIATRGSIG